MKHKMTIRVSLLFNSKLVFHQYLIILDALYDRVLENHHFEVYFSAFSFH